MDEEGLNFTAVIPSHGGCSSLNSLGPSDILENVRALRGSGVLWVLFPRTPRVRKMMGRKQAEDERKKEKEKRKEKKKKE